MCTNETMNRHIKEFRRIAAEMKALESEKKKHQEFIIQELKSRNEKSYSDKGYKCTFVSFEKDNVSAKALKEVSPELFEKLNKPFHVEYIR